MGNGLKAVGSPGAGSWGENRESGGGILRGMQFLRVGLSQPMSKSGIAEHMQVYVPGVGHLSDKGILK